MKKTSFIKYLALLPFLSQCEGEKKRDPLYTAMTRQDREDMKDSGRIFGDPIFSTKKKKDDGEDSGIPVNAYLWRASLDTFSFMPFQKVEPFSGVIMTDWHTPPGTTNERLKVNVMILDRELRPDAVRVALFRQVYDQKKGWIDVAIDPKTQEDLENTILSRARTLKHESNL